MGFTISLLLPQSLMRIQDEPNAIKRQIKGGGRGVAGAVDGLRVLVAAEYVDGLVLELFTMNFDDRVGAMHVGLSVPGQRASALGLLADAVPANARPESSCAEPRFAGGPKSGKATPLHV